MESMDNYYFANTGPQAYHYLGYGADGGLLHAGVSNDGTGPIPVSCLARRANTAKKSCLQGGLVTDKLWLEHGELYGYHCILIRIILRHCFRSITWNEHRLNTSSYDFYFATSTTSLYAPLSRQWYRT